MRSPAHLLVSLGLALSALPLISNAAEVSSAVTPVKVAVGDPIELRIEMTYGEGEKFELPPAAEKLGELTVLSFERGAPVKREDGSIVERAVYKLAGYQLGKLTVPVIEVKRVAPDPPEIFKTEAAEVEIVSLLTGNEQDIEDIKAPMSIPYEVPWLLVGIAATALVLTALAIWFWRRRRRLASLPAGSIPEAPLLSPEDEAVEGLKRLEAAGYLQRGETKPYCVGLSDILKRYISRRHGVPVEERTTSEIIDSSADVMPAEVFSLLRSFLERADMVKFAKYRATPEEIREMVRWTYRVIEVSRPQAQQETVAAT